MDASTYMTLKEIVISMGYADEIDWSDSVKPVSDPYVFWREHAWVVLNSGMKNQVAAKIWERVQRSHMMGFTAHAVFGHRGKCDAIEYVRSNCQRLLSEYLESDDKLAFLRTLPWIGKITCWHLAKNYGLDVAKPDRHLQRISGAYGTTTEELCSRLAMETGDRVATVDLVIWRAANLGMV